MKGIVVHYFRPYDAHTKQPVDMIPDLWFTIGSFSINHGHFSFFDPSGAEVWLPGCDEVVRGLDVGSLKDREIAFADMEILSLSEVLSSRLCLPSLIWPARKFKTIFSPAKAIQQ